jgi:hypothetical protein
VSRVPKDAFFHKATGAERFLDDPFDALRFRIVAFIALAAFETLWQDS